MAKSKANATETTTDPKAVDPAVAAAEKAAAEAAAKVKADADAKKAKEKADKEAKQEADKAAKLKVKQDAENKAVNDAGVSYGELSNVLTNSNSVVASLSETSTSEDVKKAETALIADLKSAKVHLAAINGFARKFKDSATLAEGVKSAQGLFEQVEKARNSIKDAITKAKAFDKAEKDRLAQEAKDAKQKEKEANRMPEQNGVRRPKPDTECGKAWAIMDAITAKIGSPAPISYVLKKSEHDGLNIGNVKTEYARWKKFNNVVGRVEIPMPSDL